VVTSKCSLNHFISKKYKTVQSFKLHFFKINSNDCKGVGNIPGSHFVKAFSALRCVLNDVSSITMLISVKGTGKNHLQPGQERKGDAPVL
jgi:hypothetical protein